MAKPEFEEIVIYLKQATTEAKIFQINFLLSSTHYKRYKQQKGRKLLWDAGKYSVSKCNRLYMDKTH